MRTEYRFFPFEVGQVIAYCPARNTALSKAARLVSAVVLRTSGTTLRQQCEGLVQFEYRNEWLTVQLLDGSGKAKRIKAAGAVQAGWCAACAVPAHHNPAGGLRCPQCAAPCVEPPPDLWIVRTFPDAYDYGARTVAQGVRAPQLSQRAIWEVLRTIDNTRRRAFEERFQVNPFRFGSDTSRELERAAVAEDADTYAAILARAERRAAGLRFLAELVCGLADEGEPSHDLPQGAPVDMPADDRTPDGEDSVTRWLAGQVQRHEQRAGRV